MLSLQALSDGPKSTNTTLKCAQVDIASVIASVVQRIKMCGPSMVSFAYYLYLLLSARHNLSCMRKTIRFPIFRRTHTQFKSSIIASIAYVHGPQMLFRTLKTNTTATFQFRLCYSILDQSPHLLAWYMQHSPLPSAHKACHPVPDSMLYLQ